MRDICTQVQAASPISGIDFNYFVYEMELKKLKQPFFYTHYYIYLFACILPLKFNNLFFNVHFITSSARCIPLVFRYFP